jgi:Txe/YoeB family toxin of Txe-Axe toxin-antitoxin module
MKEIRVQYLLIFEKGSICSDVKSVCNLFQANSDISISKSSLSFKGINFQIEINKTIKDGDFRYFQLDIVGDDDSSIDKQTELLKELRRLTFNNKGKIEILLDEISFYYSQKAYPLIYKVENLMRKLISLFLIERVGVTKAKNAIPIELDIKQSNNFLNQTDFIHLGEILTKEYSSYNVADLYKQIKRVEKIEELKLEELKSFIPKSNLDRYFKDYIDCDAGFLNKKWRRLYELRCLVAHNNFFTSADFEELVNLIEEVKLKLKNAIEKINYISIPDSEKDSVLEFTITNSNQLLGEFINEWKVLEKKLFEFTCSDKRTYPVTQNIKKMTQSGFLTRELYHDIMHLNAFRNQIVHLTETTFINEDILRNIEIVKRLNRQIVLKDEFGESWPFIVDKGLILNKNNAVIFRYENTEYGLNGFSLNRGYEEVENIWADNPAIPGTKISIGQMIDIGLKINKST